MAAHLGQPAGAVRHLHGDHRGEGDTESLGLEGLLGSLRTIADDSRHPVVGGVGVQGPDQRAEGPGGEGEHQMQAEDQRQLVGPAHVHRGAGDHPDQVEREEGPALAEGLDEPAHEDHPDQGHGNCKKNQKGMQKRFELGGHDNINQEHGQDHGQS